MPFGPWANFAACKRDVEAKQGYSDEQSDKVCGKLKDKLEKGKAFHTGSRPRVTSTAVNRTRRGDTSGDMRVKIDGKAYSRKDPAIKYLFLDKGEVVGNFLVKSHKNRVISPHQRSHHTGDPRTRAGPAGREALRGMYAEERKEPGITFGEAMNRHMNKGEKSTQELPRAEKDKDEWKKKDDVPIPDYERPDKCSDVEVTPPEKKIKKLDKGEVIGNFLVKAFKTTPEIVRTMRQAKKDIKENPLNKKWENEDIEAGMKLHKDSKNECPCAGAKVEMEHKDTLLSLGIPEDKIPEAAKKIAADHVKEDPEYYKKLKQMESVHKAEVEPDPEESEIRELRLKSRLSPSIKDLKELKPTEVKEVEKGDVKKEWLLDLDSLMKSDRDFSGTFHKPVIDKENDIIPSTAMDKAMDDFMILPTLQEVHTERPVGIITKAWKNGDDEYYLEGKIKPGEDCDDVWQKIKKGEYDGLSIGGRRVKYSKECAVPSLIRDTPCVTHRLKLYNVSVCSSPVNPEASIDEVNKLAKSETGVGEEVFDLTETLKKAMTAGTSSSTGSNLNHGIFDGRKKDVTETEFDKGAWTSKRGITTGLQQTSTRAAEVRPRTAQRPNNAARVLRVNRARFGKSTITQLIDSINEISKGLLTHRNRAWKKIGAKPDAGSLHEYRGQMKRAEKTLKDMRESDAAEGLKNMTKGVWDRTPDKSGISPHGLAKFGTSTKGRSMKDQARGVQGTARVAADIARHRDVERSDTGDALRSKRAESAAEGLKNMTKGTFQENRAGLGHMRSRSPLSHPDETLGHRRPGEKTFEHVKPSRRNPNLHNSTQLERARAGNADLRVKDKGRDGFARGRTVNPHSESRYKTIGKSDIYQLIDSINEISKGFHTHMGKKIKEYSNEGKQRYAARTAHFRDRTRELDSTHRVIYNEPIGTSSAMEGLKNMTKSDDDEQKPIRQSERVKRKEKSQGEDYHDGKLEKGDTMDEEFVEDVENVEKGDDELITKSDIDALTEAIVGLQKSFESYFATLTTPQPQKIEGKKHEVEDTMQKAEDETPVNNMEVISKAYDDKIKALEEKIAKMENTTIRKGGEAVIIPEQLQSNDSILTNMGILNGVGRVVK